MDSFLVLETGSWVRNRKKGKIFYNFRKTFINSASLKLRTGFKNLFFAKLKKVPQLMTAWGPSN